MISQTSGTPCTRMLTQMSVKADILKFGEKRNETLLKRNKTTTYTNVGIPKWDMSGHMKKVKSSQIPFVHKQRAIRYITVKSMCQWMIPERCATKAKQSSPTVSMEVMMLFCEIDSEECKTYVINTTKKYCMEHYKQHYHSGI